MTGACQHCQGRGKAAFETPFTMAFQPIFDIANSRIFAHEALVRPIGGGSAADILNNVTEDNRYAFDQACRTTAIGLAAQLGMRERLSINVMPNAVYDPDTCIQRTLWAAEKNNFPTEALIFEFTEGERIVDTAHLKRIITRYRELGFATAFDDFGAGYSGLGLLAELQPDLIKIDRSLLTAIDTDPVRQSILRNIKSLCDSLGITVIGEGIETEAECRVIVDAGITLIQGFLLARPCLADLVKPEAIVEALKPMARKAS